MAAGRAPEETTAGRSAEQKPAATVYITPAGWKIALCVVQRSFPDPLSFTLTDVRLLNQIN